jgi:hypothetical protein
VNSSLLLSPTWNARINRPLQMGRARLDHPWVTYNLAVWEGEPPAGDDEAGAVFVELMERAGRSDAAPTPRIREYVEALLARWPDITEDAGEDSPWGDGPIMNNATGTLFYFSLIWSQAEQASAYCAEVARARGLVCYDPQAERLRS